MPVDPNKSVFQPLDPKDLQGPFSGFLSPPTPSQTVTQPQGPVSPLGGIAMVATSFLEGATKGRIKAYEERENAKHQKITSLNSYFMNTIANNQDLTQEAKNRAAQIYSQGMGGELQEATKSAGKAKDGEQGPHHHLTNILKDIASGMTGGKTPKGVKDPGDAMAKIQGEIFDGGKPKPEYSVSGIVQSNTENITNAIKALPPGATQEDALKAGFPYFQAIEKSAGKERADSIRNDVLGQFQTAPKIGSDEYQREQANRGAFGPPQAPSPVGQSNVGPPAAPSGMPAVMSGDKLAAFPAKDRSEREITFTGPDGKPARGFGTYLTTARGSGWYVEDPTNPNQSIRVTGVQAASLTEPKPPALKDVRITMPDGTVVIGTEDPTKPPKERWINATTDKPIDPAKVVSVTARDAPSETGLMKQYDDANRWLKSGTPEQKLAAQQWLNERKQISEGRSISNEGKKDNLPPGPPSIPASGKFTPQQETLVRLAQDSLRGALTGARGVKMANQVSAGLDLISKKTNIPVEDLKGRQAARDTAVTDLKQLIKVRDLTKAPENSLKIHADTLIAAREKLPSSDIRKINEWWQAGAAELNASGLSDAAAKYALALQAVRTEYARIIGGGLMSNAQTHAAAMKKGEEIISAGMKKSSVKAAVEQMKLEVEQRLTGYQQEIDGLQKQVNSPIVPELDDNAPPKTPSGKPSTEITTPDGKKIDPSQFFKAK